MKRGKIWLAEVFTEFQMEIEYFKKNVRNPQVDISLKKKKKCAIEIRLWSFFRYWSVWSWQNNFSILSLGKVANFDWSNLFYTHYEEWWNW